MASPLAQLDPDLVQAELVDIVRRLLREMGRAELASLVSANSHLTRELGLGSLELAELVLECEQRFNLKLQGQLLEELETPAAWAQRISEQLKEQPLRPAYRLPAPPSEILPEPRSARTLVEVLVQHAEADPGRVHAHVLEDSAGVPLTYGELYEQATAIAGALAEAGLERNDPVGILLPNSADFLCAFLGTQIAGGIPLPLHPPTRPAQLEDYVRRQIAVLRRVDIRVLICPRELRPIVQIFRANLPHLLGVFQPEQLRRTKARLAPGTIRPSELAVLQLTSGTTADPKVVVLRHEQVLTNLRGIGEVIGVRPDDVLVSWLPLYSDLGLIGCWLFSFYYAVPMSLLSPLEVLQHPERWLWAIHESRGTLSAAPNFAYDLCTRRIPAWALEGLDLSTWRVAVNGAEPVLPETIDRFIERFRRYGFRAEAMVPAYGLAEATVALTMPPVGRPPVRDRVRRDRFEKDGVAEPATPSDSTAIQFVCLGRPVAGQEIRIVDEHGHPLPERHVGRLVFRGPCTMDGYYRDPEMTRAATEPDGWIHTGDYGYIADGEFYFTGRSKDILLKSGRAVSPFEVEAALGELPGVLPGSAVLFTAPEAVTGTELLVTVAETRAIDLADLRRIEAEIARLVESWLGMPPDRIQLLEPQTLPRTPTGKIRRNDIRTLWLKGKLRAVRRPPWLQLMRLWAENLLPLTRLGLARLRWNFTDLARRVGVAVVAYTLGTWVRWRRSYRLVRAATRWLLRAKGVRFRVYGEERIPHSGALLVANRAGALDPLVLCAGLPMTPRFADLSALYGLEPPLRYLLAPLVVEFPDPERARPAGKLRLYLREAFRRGQLIVGFPDNPPGTQPAISAFHLDLFRAAIEAQVPIYPVMVKDRPGRRHPSDPQRPSRVAMAVVREPVPVSRDEDPRCIRERVRKALGGRHA